MTFNEWYSPMSQAHTLWSTQLYLLFILSCNLSVERLSIRERDEGTSNRWSWTVRRIELREPVQDVEICWLSFHFRA